MDHLARLFNPPPDRPLSYIVGASVLTTLAVLAAARLALRRGRQAKIYPSPRETLLPKLSESDIAALPYPPDVLPGGRDVGSPYGTVRVYEWGPVEGMKVLMIHGISTTCISLGGVAHGLVERGCRVMLIDLWGRGYSDECADLPHDDRLYTTEILLAVTSSSLSWTGGRDGGFNLLGYSLGGGIAANFASYFPDMVKSLVLLAPSGIIRPQHMSGRSRLLISMGLMPEAVVSWIVTRRLKAGPMYSNENKITVGTAVSAEMESSTDTIRSPPLSKARPGLTIQASIAWQLDAHVGFAHAFMSSVRFAPITAQQAAWRRLAHLRGKTLIIAGRTDPIIIHAELRLDAEALLGKEKVEWRLIDGSHDFPITDATVVVGEISAFWGL